jgi:UDP-galactopyranose mutase
MTIMPSEYGTGTAPDLVCLSHLRWDWVFQRPQHLMTRAARDRRVFVLEEPIEDATVGPARPRLEVRSPQHNLVVATPHLAPGLPAMERVAVQRALLDAWLQREVVEDFTLWYYTPMALPFTSHLAAAGVVYDCMDELSGFAGAPPELVLLERQLFATCDIVFTGGQSLYESKRRYHAETYAMPSSVDTAHFARARTCRRSPADQAGIPTPRLGYCGVIDERLDLDLVARVAALRPDWQIVLLGPVTKIDPADLPTAPNIHYLGGKAYSELPCYLAGWDVALLPFAHNESTRFISPTKTPEYLASGRHVVSTSVRDVVRDYGGRGVVEIADGVDDFVAAIERCLGDEDVTRLSRVDDLLAPMSWDRTWDRMQVLMARAMMHPRGAVEAPRERRDAAVGGWSGRR